MSKDVFTKRSELVCGKLDELAEILIQMDSLRGIDLVRSIQNDVQKMENKLAERKQQMEEYDAFFSEFKKKFIRTIKR